MCVLGNDGKGCQRAPRCGSALSEGMVLFPVLPVPNSIRIKGISSTLYAACPYLMALCHPHACWLHNSTGQLCFGQHLSSSGGRRTLPAQGKTPLLQLQTRKMERVCLISPCLCCVLWRTELQVSPGCGPLPYRAKNDIQVPTHEGNMDGKDMMGNTTWDGVMCCLRCPHLQSPWFLLCLAWTAETSFTTCFGTSQPGNCSSERGRESEEEICN